MAFDLVAALAKGKAYTVLYVEDDTEVQELLVEQLQSFFKHVFTATNGVEGLEAYKTHNPDLIITDITMPIMNGLEMSKEIREHNQHIPIITLTAHSDEAYFLESFDNEITKYVLKPVNMNKLREAMAYCIHMIDERHKAKEYEKKMLQTLKTLYSKEYDDRCSSH